MNILVELARRLAHLFQRNATNDLEEEMRFHLDMKAQSYREAGMNEQAATLAAKKKIGNAPRLIEESRAAWGWTWIESCWQDIRYTLRGLRKSPGFASVAILSLALGIGANTVVFSVLNALILRDLPFKDPSRVYAMNRSGGPGQSIPNYKDIRDRNSVFESLYSSRITLFSISNGNAAQLLWGCLVTGNYFATLGVTPALGNFFGPNEDRNPGESPYVVISNSLWRRQFGSDPEIIGKTVRINNRSFTVMAVTRPDFHGTEVFFWPDLWVPMTMQKEIEGYAWLNERNTHNAWVGGRLKPNVTVEQAEANLKVIANQLAREHKSNEGMVLTLTRPGMVGETLRKPASAFLNGLMLLAALVLIAACVNLASLLSARASDRLRELAVRVSIGAGRGRIVRQLLTESFVISLLGGLAGCGVGWIALRTISQWHAPLDFPVQFDVNADWRVFAFAFAVSMIVGGVISVGSAHQAWKTDPALGMKGIGSQSSRRWSVRDLLLPIQVTLCCILVVASLVAVRGMARSFRTPLGFQPDHVAVAGYHVSLAGYGEEEGRAYQKRVVEAIRQLPGVISAAHASTVPMSMNQSGRGVFPEGTTDFRPKNARHSTYYLVSPNYFQTIGTSLIAGRDFTDRDNKKSPLVAVVNQTFAKRVVGTADAVGRRFLLGGSLTEIVGIVEDGKYETLTEDPKLALFLPMDQHYSSDAVIIARSNRREFELAGEMRTTLTNLDSQVPVFSVGSLRQMLALAYLPMQAAVIALGAFGLLAAMLAATGVYGISSYAVSRRVREIGIRMAIGAQNKQILKLIFSRTGKLVTAGAIVGLALGMAGAKLLESIVYQANSRDPVVIAATILSIAGIAIAAAWVPARRAMKVNPVDALRSE